MNSRISLIFIFVFLRLLLVYGQTPGLDNNSSGDYKLVWKDEFNENILDTTKWIFDNETNPNWNGELQYYTTRPENIYLNDGKLYIVAKHENYTFNNETRNYTSAKIRTKSKAAWKFGKIVARAKIPFSGNGIWPAIWMLPTNNYYGSWPNSGEIDIMEYVGHMPNIIHGTIHTKAYNHIDGTEKGSSIKILNISQEFHDYSIEWNNEFIKFAVDGKVYYEFNNGDKTWKEWPFNHNFYLILNLAIRGSWGGKKGIDTTNFPSTMEIDFIRVYQKDK